MNHNPAPWATDRRRFLKTSAFTAAGFAFARMPVMAGPFTREDFDQLVPADKKLSPEWVKALFERGERTVYRGKELEKIGMPVGGICTGQLYLGGDGRLWHWDIFNQPIGTGSEHYANPLQPASPLTQKFSLKIGDQTHTLDRDGFPDISFRGEYPIGVVEYAGADVPLAVKLEAFSPFTPLDADDSGLPATILQFTLSNPSAAVVEAVLSGELENGVCLHSRANNGNLCNRIVRGSGFTALVCSAEKTAPQKDQRPEMAFENWDKDNYQGWKVEGTAFGSGPVKKSEMPVYQGNVGGPTARVANSHATAPGDAIEAKDGATGKLISREFVIERNFIAFWIGGGKARPNSRSGLTLIVDGQPVQTAAGQDNNQMAAGHFDVRKHAGKTARLEIIDDASGGWGNIGVGRIWFTDQLGGAEGLEELPDFGTMSLALLGQAADEASTDATVPFTEKLSGSLGRKLKLAPGASATVTFVLAWHFPNLPSNGPMRDAGRYYATRFSSAQAVVEYIAAQFDRLAGQTRLWRDTWYDSTLPFWLLDRTHANASILATSTAFRYASGRFYGNEGVGCCAGTCTHVWQYEQTMGRLFPELDILLRERADFDPKVSFKPDGMIDHRGEFNAGHAIDGQAGTLLRAYRDHQMSPDNAFLKRNYASIKKAMQWLISQDGNADGILEGAQHNTLDAAWFGPVAWLSGLYLASLRAVAEMAADMEDDPFASECRTIAGVGSRNLVKRLFDDGYFINQPDPKHLDAINSGTGCEIDQVMGQGWAFQVGLDRVLPQQETRSALQSLWRYNFSPDVGPYRAVNKPGRWYAMAGEAGLLMCTFPRKDWSFSNAQGKGNVGFAGYFNECMNGFEYQAAGHMVWEGMVQEGLAVTRAIHDRYHASKRNPWNEVECGDHYARSMASYGVFIAACGFEYYGPRQHLGFAPKLTPENFKAAFTSAEGWGSYAQKIDSGKLKAEISLCWGKMKLKTIALEFPQAATPSVKVELAGKILPAQLQRRNSRVVIALPAGVTIQAGQALVVSLA
ncbi:MAG: hypothetical protein K9N23_00575 [Akkermansiaceae bacterium]|nr:hypothetical protein [Akkermansiaceae bacterium]